MSLGVKIPAMGVVESEVGGAPGTGLTDGRPLTLRSVVNGCLRIASHVRKQRQHVQDNRSRCEKWGCPRVILEKKYSLIIVFYAYGRVIELLQGRLSPAVMFRQLGASAMPMRTRFCKLEVTFFEVESVKPINGLLNPPPDV